MSKQEHRRKSLYIAISDGTDPSIKLSIGDTDSMKSVYRRYKFNEKCVSAIPIRDTLKW